MDRLLSTCARRASPASPLANSAALRASNQLHFAAIGNSSSSSSSSRSLSTRSASPAIKSSRDLYAARTEYGSKRYSTARHEPPTQMRMLIVGCPGSGKGTLSGRLLKRYDMQALSAGDVLRSHIQAKTEIGQQAAQVIAQGSLMPDDIMMRLIGSEVEKLQDSNWLLDGFPRTLGQAQLLDGALRASGKPLNLVVNLDVPEEIILQRIMDRWTHIPSGRIYNLSYNPPKVLGKDDVTGEPLEKRADDNPEVFAKRLSSFHSKTGPMLAYYRDKSPAASSAPADEALYVNIYGTTSDEIWPRLSALVEERFPHLAQKL